MEPIYFFKNLRDAEQEEIRAYLEKKLPKIEKLVTRFSSDSVSFHVRCERFNKHSAYEVELTLALGSDKHTASEASHTIVKAVDLAEERLTSQIRKKTVAVRRTHRSVRMRNAVKKLELMPEMA